MSDWSSKIAARFNLRLPADVVDWLDAGTWQQWSEVHFCQGVDPALLLDTGAAQVMGGLMLPDTLPIMDNGCGDVLALRIDSTGTVSEVVRWMHEGCDWTPYGQSMSDALVLDAVLTMTEQPPDQRPRLEEFPFARWVRDRLKATDQRAAVRQLFSIDHVSLSDLLTAGVAETAVRCQLCQQCWRSGLLRHCQATSANQWANQLGVPWPEFSQWLLDTERIPLEMAKKLAKATRLSIEELLQQDWQGAARQAEEVCRRRKDLTWPFAVLGWEAERNGNRTSAVGHYIEGLSALGTAADFTENWGAWPPRNTKFVGERLKELRDALPAAALENEYLRTALESEHAADFFRRVRKHWCHQADLAEAAGRHAQAYHHFYRAGWDVHVFDEMELVLDGMARNAAAAGWAARASLARHHRECLAC